MHACHSGGIRSGNNTLAVILVCNMHDVSTIFENRGRGFSQKSSPGRAAEPKARTKQLVTRPRCTSNKIRLGVGTTDEAVMKTLYRAQKEIDNRAIGWRAAANVMVRDHALCSNK